MFAPPERRSTRQRKPTVPFDEIVQPNEPCPSFARFPLFSALAFSRLNLRARPPNFLGGRSPEVWAGGPRRFSEKYQAVMALKSGNTADEGIMTKHVQPL